MKKISVIALMFLLSACGMEIVDTGYRGVETRFGAVVGEPLSEGPHFYNPFTSNITEYSDLFLGASIIFGMVVTRLAGKS